MYKNSDVLAYARSKTKYLIGTSLVKTNVEISNVLFVKYVAFIDKLSEILNENNKNLDSSKRVYFCINSLKEPRTSLSTHDVNNDKFAIDLQLNVIGHLRKFPNVNILRNHLCVNMFWVKFLKRNKIPYCDVYRIGAGTMTYHLHISEFFQYPLRLFENTIKPDVSSAFMISWDEVDKIINHLDFITTKKLWESMETNFRVLIPIFYVNKIDIIESDSEYIGDFEQSLNILSETIVEGSKKTINDVQKKASDIGKSVGSFIPIILGMYALLIFTNIRK